MTALETANKKFDAAIRELEASTEKPPVDKRELLPPAARLHMAQQRQLSDMLYIIAGDMVANVHYPVNTIKLAESIRRNAALFEAQEIERLG